MIEAGLRGGGFTSLLASMRRQVSRRTDDAARSDRWRRADLLWPDFAPRWKD